MRKVEGGVRASKESCFSNATNREVAKYNPLFWWSDEDKSAFENEYGVTHSDAYTVYGLKRTGCAGCPFNSKAEQELKQIEEYEPQLCKAVRNIFAPSYEYRNEYRQYKETHRKTKRRKK